MACAGASTTAGSVGAACCAGGASTGAGSEEARAGMRWRPLALAASATAVRQGETIETGNTTRRGDGKRMQKTPDDDNEEEYDR